MFLLWLVAFTGLLLNHSWAFAELRPNRHLAQSTHPVATPASPAPLARAGLPAFSFGLVRPGQHWQVILDESAARANDARPQRDGLLSAFWAFAMDSLALTTGRVLCALLLSGLRWLS
ncbi:MAG: hypothetical protein INH40_02805 [Acidobacteriaceae bacterium]|nr:hypothetical protein [Acidobacteriaceae bacterium]